MSKRWKEFSLYVPGTVFITLGILVVLFPMILVALISAGFLLIGFTAMLVAHRLRKLRQGGERAVVWEPVEPFFGEWFDRVFIYRRW
jgi:hypothetical protein